ncbi:MAG: type II and III secretion system protein family protein [Geminicoccaceae bacterium]|nr:type II and III secretion system protein family protein [Geminicoccaceae bacterium]
MKHLSEQIKWPQDMHYKQLVLFLCIFSLLFIVPNAWAIETQQSLQIEVRQGQIIKLPRPASAVFVADPETADVQAHSPSLIYIFGKKTGTTSIFAVDSNDDVIMRSKVTIVHPLTVMQNALETVAPGNDFQLNSIEGGVIVKGTAASKEVVNNVEAVIGRFIGENERIINQVKITNPLQVNLKVKIAEFSRSSNKLIGFNWESLFNFDNLSLAFSVGREFQSAAGGFTRRVVSSGNAGQLGLGLSSSNINIDGIIDILEREGLVTVLAEPNLTAKSGETAKFLAGGEFPIPVAQQDNEIKIEFKQFGVSLEFTPTVLNNNQISLNVKPEVSDLSDNGSVQIGDLRIPALTTRKAETTIELGDGQSFAIGGLISNSMASSIEKFPGIGDLPVVGALFRSSEFRQQQSELVIIVTPYLIQDERRYSNNTLVDDISSPSMLDMVLRNHLSEGLKINRYSRSNLDKIHGPAGVWID